MPTQVEQIAASKQREHIPQQVLLIFEDTTNDGLMSMAIDEWLGAKLRAFAAWELEYRQAFGVDVFWHEETLGPEGKQRRGTILKAKS